MSGPGRVPLRSCQRDIHLFRSFCGPPIRLPSLSDEPPINRGQRLPHPPRARSPPHLPRPLPRSSLREDLLYRGFLAGMVGSTQQVVLQQGAEGGGGMEPTNKKIANIDTDNLQETAQRSGSQVLITYCVYGPPTSGTIGVEPPQSDWVRGGRRLEVDVTRWFIPLPRSI